MLQFLKNIEYSILLIKDHWRHFFHSFNYKKSPTFLEELPHQHFPLVTLNSLFVTEIDYINSIYNCA